MSHEIGDSKRIKTFFFPRTNLYSAAKRITVGRLVLYLLLFQKYLFVNKTVLGVKWIFFKTNA